jgi:hypothetical protein
VSQKVDFSSQAFVMMAAILASVATVSGIACPSDLALVVLHRSNKETKGIIT